MDYDKDMAEGEFSYVGFRLIKKPCLNTEWFINLKFVTMLYPDYMYYYAQMTWRQDGQGRPRALLDKMVPGLIHVQPSGLMATVSGSQILGR